MALNHPVVGEGYAPAYQISSVPFVTSSTLTLGEIKQINFSTVSRFLILKNTGATATAMAVAFTNNGLKPANSNYFILSGSDSFSAEVRTDRIFLSGSVGASTFTLFAGLTYVPSANFLTITGSNGYNGVG